MWLYIVLSVLILATSTITIVFSFPVTTILSQEGYNAAYLAQMSFTVVLLVVILWHLNSKI